MIMSKTAKITVRTSSYEPSNCAGYQEKILLFVHTGNFSPVSWDVKSQLKQNQNSTTFHDYRTIVDSQNLNKGNRSEARSW